MIRPVKPGDAHLICDIYNYYVHNTCVTPEEQDVSVCEMERRIANVTKEFPWFVSGEGGTLIGLM